MTVIQLKSLRVSILHTVICNKIGCMVQWPGYGYRKNNNEETNDEKGKQGEGEPYQDLL